MPEPATLAALTAAFAAAAPVIEVACRTFEAVTGTPLEVAGAMLQDASYRRRVRNLLVFLEDVAPRVKALRDAGIDVRPLSDEFGLPLFRAVETVRDDGLRGMWVGLLESGLTSPSTQRPVYVRTLSALCPSDAQTLREIAACLSAGLQASRIVELLPDIGVLQALGVIDVSAMPVWFEGSLGRLAHTRRVRGLLASPRTTAAPTDNAEPGSSGTRGHVELVDGFSSVGATVRLSELGAGLIDAVEVRSADGGWHARAANRTHAVLLQLHECLPLDTPGSTPEELAALMSGHVPSVSARELRTLWYGYRSTNNWKRRDGRWYRVESPAQ